jgi:pimeloyl-ACP methyl ester carboxylesterase
MDMAKVNGIALEFEVKGSGEPVLLIGTGPFADSFLPLFSEDALAGGYKLIRYRQRGQVGGLDQPGPVSFANHGADAADLLAHLGIERAHVAGHSTGASIALQLAYDRPELVHSLALLEPPLMAAPAAAVFLERIGPALEAYAQGQRERAMAAFLSVVTSLEWDHCRQLVDQRVPGGVAQAMAGTDTFFGSYLPALGAWGFDEEKARRIVQPVLSVIGTETDPWFVESCDMLRSWIPQVEKCAVERAAHLLHIQQPEPVARCMAEFFRRHPMTGTAIPTAAILHRGGTTP